jgi:hypothetical protein
MNAGPSSDFPPGDDLDPRHDAMWRLLGRAPLPEPDAWFAARTLARCRSEKQVAVSLARVWRWALGGGLGICLAVSLLVSQVSVPQSQQVEQHKNVQEAFEIVASMNNADTDSSASSSSWQDSSL